MIERGVWVLVSTRDDQHVGYFSTPEKAVAWLRKSRRYMRPELAGGPLVPVQHDGYWILNEEFTVTRHEIDPPPLDESYAWSVTGMGAIA